MRSSFINPITVSIVGTVLCVLAAFGIIYGLILPQQDAINTAQQRYDAAYPDSTPLARNKAQTALKQAQTQVAQIQSQWAVQESTLMPRFDVSNRLAAWNQLSYELSQYLGPDIERWIPQTGVTTTTRIALAAPPVSPNDINGAPRVIPLGNITVVGDFRRILTHVLKWNDFNRLVLIDRLALNGNSPYMQGSYTATVYIFPQNDDKVDKTIPQAGGGGGAAGGAPGGGYGGPPAGYGGPPPGYGGPPPGYGGPPAR